MLAAAAIGVSHLVQSTRAGADYGYQLLGVVILANLLKYPFFEIGHRYYIATGETLLHGYKKLGRGYLLAFLVLNFVGAIGTVAAVTFVTAALLQTLFPFNLSVVMWSLVLISVSVALLVIGRYKWLDRFIKLLMAVLLVTTISAVLALVMQDKSEPVQQGLSAFSWEALPFLIALMGWMPAPIELSVWQSLWLEAKERTEGERPTKKQAAWDFNFGYIATLFLAMGFLSLGAEVMYGRGVSFSNKPFLFASQVVDLYTSALGDWSRPLITVAAITAMFSTTLTVIDSYPRSLSEGVTLLAEKEILPRRIWSSLWVALVSGLGLVVISFFTARLKGIVDFVTIISFLSAPVFAWLNLKLIRSNHVPEHFRQGTILRKWSYVGLSFLVVFGLLFLYHLGTR